MDIQPEKQRITFGKFQNVDLRVARIVQADEAAGTNPPCRILTLDLGPLGLRQSVGQFALVSSDELVGQNVIACINLAPKSIAPGHESEVLVLGTDHPASPPDERQATPLLAAGTAEAGSAVF